MLANEEKRFEEGYYINGRGGNRARAEDLEESRFRAGLYHVVRSTGSAGQESYGSLCFLLRLARAKIESVLSP